MKKLKAKDCNYDISFLEEKIHIVRDVLDYLDENGTYCDKPEDIAYFMNKANDNTTSKKDFGFLMYLIGMKHSIAIVEKIKERDMMNMLSNLDLSKSIKGEA